MQIQLVLAILVIATFGVASAQEGQACLSSCGNVTIAFPFGSSKRCYHSRSFLVTCNHSSGEQVPFFGESSSKMVITNMSISKGEVEIMMFVARDCYNSYDPDRNTSPHMTLSNFWISAKNKFVAIGCDTNAFFSGSRGNHSAYSTGCISRCHRDSPISNGSCSGVGCCEVAVPQHMREFQIFLSSYDNHTNIKEFNPCSYGFFVEEGKFNFSTTNLRDFESVKKMPMLLDWAIGNSTCDVARKDADSFLCKGNSICDRNYSGPGYRCRCQEGYEGNPYVANNCTNINECERGAHDCEHECVDTQGSYKCACRNGYSGDGKRKGTGCSQDQSTLIEIVLGTSAGAILLLISAIWLYLGLEKRKLILLRERYFKQNGGLMLQQQISGDGAQVFTIEELKRATNNYDESRIIGKGGFGTVYRGVLSDNRMVAIKRSKLADQSQSQIEQFINEVVILCQINHRNVVKLIGCCLETQVPLLVYEYIPNGTLSDHIHSKGNNSSSFTLDIRLRIATETAEALAYLHSAASVPIIHRDVKTVNILLDNNFVAKVADFGASRLVPMDQTEVATVVQGTLGYLDPEYLQTNQLTDKSDVYSFGVVLVELITGEKALSFDRPEAHRNLGMYFLFSLKQGRLLDVLDDQLLLDQVPNEIIQVSRLAERCLRVKGDERPTMKEVSIELAAILAAMIQNHPSVQRTRNEDEAEHLLNTPTEIEECNDKTNASSSTFDIMNSITHC